MKFHKKILNKQAILGYLFALAVLVILGFIFDEIVIPLYTKQHAEVEMPDVVDRSAVEADSLLRAQGFRMIIDKSEYNPVSPESTIVFQKPSPYTKVKRGRRIYVHISAGERQVIVPSVIGISQRDAQFRLIEAGLEIGEIHFKVSNYPKDVVCDQEIPPNSELPEKTQVGFTVSLGRSKTEYVVPNVVGQSLKEATMNIKREGLRIGHVRYEIRSDIIPNTVIYQNPPAGTQVKSNDSVHLGISQLSIIKENEGDSIATDSNISVHTGS